MLCFDHPKIILSNFRVEQTIDLRTQSVLWGPNLWISYERGKCAVVYIYFILELLKWSVHVN